MHADRNVQLLAHAGASSRRQDDMRYTAQMHAYLHLDPPRRSHMLSISSRTAASRRHDPALDVVDGGDTRMGEDTQDECTYLEDTQLAYTALGTQLHTSAPASGESSVVSASELPTLTRGTICAQTRAQQPTVHAAQTPGARSELGGLSQSSYLISPFVDEGPARRMESRETPKLELMPTRKSVTHQVPRDETFNQNAVCHTTPNANSSGHSTNATVTTDRTTSDLPSSFHLSDVTPESPEYGPRIAERTETNPPRPVSRTIGRPNSQGTQQTLTFSTSKASQLVEETATASHSEARCDPSRSSIARGSTCYDIAADRSSLRALQKLPMEIRYGEPEVGHGQFKTHLTPALRRLAQNSDISDAYNPAVVTRILRPLERGFWLVECDSWTAKQQLDFWEYLDGAIRGGRVGWGVWCTRTPNQALEPAAEITSPCQTDTDPPCVQTLGPVKVYCWGELVQHVYLLLYIASNSKVRKLALQWLDAEGEVVVRMR